MCMSPCQCPCNPASTSFTSPFLTTKKALSMRLQKLLSWGDYCDLFSDDPLTRKSRHFPSPILLFILLLKKLVPSSLSRSCCFIRIWLLLLPCCCVSFFFFVLGWPCCLGPGCCMTAKVPPLHSFLTVIFYNIGTWYGNCWKTWMHML